MSNESARAIAERAARRMFPAGYDHITDGDLIVVATVAAEIALSESAAALATAEARGAERRVVLGDDESVRIDPEYVLFRRSMWDSEAERYTAELLTAESRGRAAGLREAADIASFQGALNLSAQLRALATEADTPPETGE